MTNVIKIEEVTKESALKILSSEDETNRIIEQVRQAVSGEVPDLTTKKGRDRIKSLASRVAKSKTTIDGFGKDLVKPIKEQAKAIDANRKILRDELDALKAEVRQPLTDFENAERERIENHNEAIRYINELGKLVGDDGAPYSSDYLKASLDEVFAVVCTEDCCDEFAEQYASAKAAAISSLKPAIERQVKAEAETKELEELRQLKAQKEHEEHEAQLKTEAAEQARLDVITELEAEQKRLANEQAKREADKRYCAKINTEAKNAIIALGCDDAMAKQIVTAIAKGIIPNVTINY